MKTVLVVEDDLSIMEIVMVILASAGFNTISSQFGFELEDLVAQHIPDLVLMDIRLGELDGTELCKSLKSGVHGNIPVILMSAHAYAEDIIKDACADAFLSKPFDIDKLVALITEVINETAV